MSTRVLGRQAATEQPPASNQKGLIYESNSRTWRGTAAAIEALRNDPLFATATVRVSGSGAIRTLTAEWKGDPNEKLTVRWELDYEALAKPLEVLKPMFTDLGADVLADLNQVIDKGDKDEIAAKLSEFAESTAEGAFLRLKLAGTDSYEDFAYVVRKTTSFGVNAMVKASFSGVNEVTSVTLSCTGSNPDDPLSMATFSLPDGQYKKNPPKVTDLGNGKFAIIEEWKWAEKWEPAIYGEPA